MYKYSHIENLIKKNINPITESEIVHVNQSAGRYLAENIYSLINIPPTNNSAVDGYLFNYKVKDSLKLINLLLKKSYMLVINLQKALST